MAVSGGRPERTREMGRLGKGLGWGSQVSLGDGEGPLSLFHQIKEAISFISCFSKGKWECTSENNYKL